MGEFVILDAFATFENQIVWDNLQNDNGLETEIDAQVSVPYISNPMPSKQRQHLYNIYRNLKFNNPVALEIGYDILAELKAQGKDDAVISHTGDDQILIYRNVNGEYRNIIIDEDADVLYMCIPVNRKNTYNTLYPFIHLDASTLNNIASKL